MTVGEDVSLEERFRCLAHLLKPVDYHQSPGVGEGIGEGKTLTSQLLQTFHWTGLRNYQVGIIDCLSLNLGHHQSFHSEVLLSFQVTISADKGYCHVSGTDQVIYLGIGLALY